MPSGDPMVFEMQREERIAALVSGKPVCYTAIEARPERLALSEFEEYITNKVRESATACETRGFSSDEYAWNRYSTVADILKEFKADREQA